MTDFTDFRRTARGFKELRNRYIRRAEFLCTDPEFLIDVRVTRQEWIREFPKYRLDHPLHSRPGLFPWKPLEETAPTRDLCDRCLGPERWDAEDAEATWSMYIRLLQWRYFDGTDFHGVGGLNPWAFLQESILRDPRLLIGNIGQFFALPKLELTMDTSEYDELGIEPEEWELFHSDNRWFVPVYPGLTAEDLRAAIPRIIEQVQKYLGPQTAGARIQALHREGLT